jgi:hypothetical protein
MKTEIRPKGETHGVMSKRASTATLLVLRIARVVTGVSLCR